MRVQGTGEGPHHYYLEAGVFYQPAGIDKFGYQVSGGLDWSIGKHWRFGFLINHLNSPERGAGRYRTVGGRWYFTRRF